MKDTMNNREIKFRAWDGSEMIYPYGKGFNNILTNGNILDRFSIVMQYTGLKDRNEKEIYEGDIVKYELNIDDEINDTTMVVADGIAEVKYEEWAFWVDSYPASTATEVIGNICEHPDLIKQP